MKWAIIMNNLNAPEKKVSDFYNNIGWETQDGISEDAKRWEDLRECAKEYVSMCRLRTQRHIPKSGEFILDMASGPIQYPEYIEFSKNYTKRYCVDLSKDALAMAEQKIGSHGVYINKSFFDAEIDDNYFDCTLSLHTIYHIDKNRQEEAVRKLLNVTKKGAPVIIVYSNPITIQSKIVKILRHTRDFAKTYFNFLLPNRVKIKNNLEEAELYFYCHSLEWWKKFTDVASVNIYPWRSLPAHTQKILFPDNAFGRYMFKILFSLEEKYPAFFVKHFQYPMIVLRKY